MVRLLVPQDGRFLRRRGERLSAAVHLFEAQAAVALRQPQSAHRSASLIKHKPLPLPRRRATLMDWVGTIRRDSKAVYLKSLVRQADRSQSVAVLEASAAVQPTVVDVEGQLEEEGHRKEEETDRPDGRVLRLRIDLLYPSLHI